MSNFPPSQKPKTAGRPRKVDDPDALSTQEHILQVAKQLFRQKGYSAVSIREVVSEVGVSLPTLYYYFDDKEHLFASVLINMLQQANQHFQEHIDLEKPCSKSLYQLAEGFFRFSPTSINSLIRDANEHLSEIPLQKVNSAYEASVIEPFERIFAHAIQRGEIKALDANDLAQLFVSMLDTVTVRLSSKHGRTFNVEHYAGLYIDTFLNGVALPA